MTNKTSVEVNISVCPTVSEVENDHIRTPEDTIPNEPVQDTEDMPVPSKGYSLDFLDTLDVQDIDPFKTKSAVMNSPDKKVMDTIKGNEMEEVVKTENSQIVGQEEECIDNTESDKVKAIEVTAINPSDEKEIIKDQTEAMTTDLEKVPQKEIKQKTDNSAPEDTRDDSAPSTKGYNLDFLSKLDDPDFDPFKTTTAVANSPDQKDKVHKTVLKDNESLKASDSLTRSMLTEVISSPTPPVSEGEEQHKARQPEVIPSEEPVQVIREEKTSGTLEEIPVPSKGYNLDHLDEMDINPFKTKSSVMNSPDRKDKCDKTDEKRKVADVLIADSQGQNCKNNILPNENKTAENFVENSSSKTGCSVKGNDKLEENCKDNSIEADSKNSSQVDVFSPIPKPRACRPLVHDVDTPFPNTGGDHPQEDEFKTATDCK